MSQTTVFLASQSPRRAELLRQIGVQFRQQAVDLDETPGIGELAADYVLRLAVEKAKAGWRWQFANDVDVPLMAMGSDTTVVLAGDILGKPANREQGLAMLQRLSGCTHQVMTAVALYYQDINKQQHCLSALSVTDVEFRAVSDAELEAYWQTGEPIGKAGAYAIQGRGAIFIERIAGSYSGVVGLPLHETHQLLTAMEKIINHE